MSSIYVARQRALCVHVHVRACVDVSVCVTHYVVSMALILSDSGTSVDSSVVPCVTTNSLRGHGLHNTHTHTCRAGTDACAYKPTQPGGRESAV